jgi:ribosomal protein S18 acetylase RimI-like enzyme
MNFKNPNIVYLDWNNKEHIEAVSNLHIKLLPESILSKLGFDFLFKFYYSKLCKERLIEIYLYQKEKDFVGFIACTNNPFSFTKEGAKKYRLLIYGLLFKSILIKPFRFFDLIKQTNDLSLIEYKANKNSEQIGQFLSFGVLEEFRKNIDDIEHCSVPNVLMKKVFSHFREYKMNFFLQVLKSNIPAIKFYEKYNGKIVNTDSISESFIVEFELNN